MDFHAWYWKWLSWVCFTNSERSSACAAGVARCVGLWPARRHPPAADGSAPLVSLPAVFPPGTGLGNGNYAFYQVRRGC